MKGLPEGVYEVPEGEPWKEVPQPEPWPVARPLEEQEWALATATVQRPGERVMTLRELRERHRAAARLLAVGMRPAHVARALKMSPSTLSTLSHSPAFQALIAEMRQSSDDVMLQLRSRMVSLAHLGLDTLEDAFNAPEPDIDLVASMTKDVLDRLGLNPTMRVQTRNVSVFAANIREVKERVKARNAGGVWAQGGGPFEPASVSDAEVEPQPEPEPQQGQGQGQGQREGRIEGSRALVPAAGPSDARDPGHALRAGLGPADLANLDLGDV